MAEDKEFKFLIYVVSGIAVVSFLYFIYKDWINQRNETQYLSSIPSVNSASNNSVSNEVIYSLLGNQQNIIQNQQYQLDNISTEVKSNKEQLDKISTKLESNKEQLDYMANTKSSPPNESIKKLEITNFETPANSPSNQRTDLGDKIRKLKFNMI